MISSRRGASRRLVPGGQGVTLRALPAVLLLGVLLVLTGCPSGYVQTSTGATVAASTVHAQDLVGDALQALQDVHNAAVRAHDAKAGAEPADVHAKRREALKASAAGLRAGWSGLEAWKLGTDGAGMVAVVTPIRAALPELLRAAVALGVVSQGYADAIGVFFGTAGEGKTPAPLAKKPVQAGVVMEPAESGYALVQVPVVRYGTVVQPEGYYDGCNWHTPIGHGGEFVTAMGCGYSAVRLVSAPLTSTLENRVDVVDGKLIVITDGRPE